ncbi:hypothetical protein [Synechococcus sp. PCC 7336]|uniref:hypothetical protein n=1 Tax=Synechococcus sp. PCC 7336 TaxID=195250 RepID=UPI00037B4DCC|nr:hypothetical protein [Synechococcus sp. PCC 7336]
MSSKDYSSFKLVTKNYPDLIQISEDRFQREWSITLKRAISSETNLGSISEKLSYEGFQVLLKSLDGNLLEASVTTNYSETDYLFFNTSNLFAEIDQLLCEIELIQGQARNDWFPWLAERSGQPFKISRWIIREVDVGLRFSKQGGITFFGTEEVNEMLLHGSKVVSINPGGALTRQITRGGGDPSFEISGFFVSVRLHEHPPSLSDWTNPTTTPGNKPEADM